MLLNRTIFWRFAPFVLFILLGGFLLAALFSEEDIFSPSHETVRYAPSFDLPPLEGLDRGGFSDADLKTGRLSLVNVWASWCAPCRAEHPLLKELAQRQDIQLLGLNYKDDPANARRFLSQLGNPFAHVGSDINGYTALDWGIYGIPETFIVDGTGRIIVRHKGPLTPSVITQLITPALDRATRKAELIPLP
ncbi:MAG: DsbE family thiol:disulfide interchange protein [Parvularculales bacterium]